MYILRTKEAFRICHVRCFEKWGEDFEKELNIHLPCGIFLSENI